MAVLDASALLAYLFDEAGAEIVADAIAEGDAVISTVNLSEVLDTLSRTADQGTPDELAKRLSGSGLLGAAIAPKPFTIADAVEAARLRPLTQKVGLSLADRACLSLASRLDMPALTSDRDWGKVDHGIELLQIR